LRLLGCATNPHPTTHLTPALSCCHPTPHTNLFIGDGVFKAVDANWAFDAIRLGFNDESPYTFLKEQVA
jgi:hypothetical protein